MHWTDGNLYALNKHLAERENEIGTEPGDECGRYHQPDEDGPGGRCDGIMVEVEGEVYCDVCGRSA